jgi:predicted GH43/DUF377 family glycosyl hydrolase
MQTTHRFFHAYSDVLFPVKTETTGVPTVYEQAEQLGGKFTRIVNGLPENTIANFNPSVIRFNETNYIAWRCQPQPFGFRYDMKYFYLNGQPNDIYIGILGNDDASVIGTKKLRPKKHRLSYEDPRLFKGPDEQLYVQFITSTYASRYDTKDYKLFHQPKVSVCWVNENFDAVQSATPPIGENLVKGKPEKNWCFFSRKDELACLYSTRPLVIESERTPRIQVNTQVLDTVTRGAPTFNSTAPIDLGYGYLIFYHWKHTTFAPGGKPYLLYHVSAYMVDKEFKKVTYIVDKPLFTGSLNDRVIEWTDLMGTPVSNQPAVILPFGAYVHGTELVMSLGVNDAFMGIFRTQLENIMRLLKKVN